MLGRDEPGGAERLALVVFGGAQLRGEAPADVRECFLVADDKEGYELYFDPTSNDFVLAYSGNPPSTFNVRGDAVGCFMARSRESDMSPNKTLERNRGR